MTDSVSKWIVVAMLGAALASGCSHQAATNAASAPAPATAEACAALAEMAAPNFVVKRAELAPAGPTRIPFPPSAGMEIPTPAHCIVQGALNPRIGEGGRRFEIGFELRMPVAWNRRFLFQGGGGLDGVINPALGMTGLASPPALAQGFAVVSTDAGHQGMDASFASDPQARIDYAYNALDVVTVKAKEIATRFYGAAPDYSYFVGCSNGGRQGMIAAQRFPDLFDGIVAGDPGFRLSRAAIGQVWDNAQFMRIAPRDGQGRPIVSQALTDADLQLVSNAVLSACDAQDGLQDGMINNRAACRFDPRVLQCRRAAAANCLSREKVGAVQAVFNGARDSGGQQIYATWPYDAGLAERDWRAWKLGDSPSGTPNGLNQTLGLDAFSRYFATPPYASLDPLTYNFDEAAARVAETGLINDAAATDLTRFSASGGRMIIYQGVSDPVFSADDIVAWYAAAHHQTEQTTRLFLVPGMNHCAGGPSTDQFNALGVLQDWVERGQPPERIVARGRQFPGVTRPLCPHPSYAHYTGGDTNSEASFQCRAP